MGMISKSSTSLTIGLITAKIKKMSKETKKSLFKCNLDVISIQCTVWPFYLMNFTKCNFRSMKGTTNGYSQILYVNSLHILLSFYCIRLEIKVFILDSASLRVNKLIFFKPH
jgi:hypothetical protein